MARRHHDQQPGLLARGERSLECIYEVVLALRALYVEADALEAAIRGMKDGTVDPDTDPAELIALQGVRFFAGYASWAPGQLDAELVDDAWIVLDAAQSDLLHPEPAELWWTVVGRQRSDIRLLANYPSEPWVN